MKTSPVRSGPTCIFLSPSQDFGKIPSHSISAARSSKIKHELPTDLTGPGRDPSTWHMRIIFRDVCLTTVFIDKIPDSYVILDGLIEKATATEDIMELERTRDLVARRRWCRSTGGSHDNDQDERYDWGFTYESILGPGVCQSVEDIFVCLLFVGPW